MLTGLISYKCFYAVTAFVLPQMSTVFVYYNFSSSFKMIPVTCERMCNTYVPYDLAIQFLGMFPRNSTFYCGDCYTTIFTAVLITISGSRNSLYGHEKVISNVNLVYVYIDI